jgi:hypothetical protein
MMRATIFQSPGFAGQVPTVSDYRNFNKICYHYPTYPFLASRLDSGAGKRL